MTRLIDADVVYEWYLEAFKGQIKPNEIRFSINDICGNLQNIPTIDAEPQWIPCSERMPNDDEDYLVTDGESMAVGYYRTDAKAWDNVNFGWLEYREETCGIKKVIAWMPLPEPYEVNNDGQTDN